MDNNENVKPVAAARDYESMIAELTERLADSYRWNWRTVTDQRSAADRVLTEMVEIGLIDGRHHPLALSSCPTVYRVNGKLFGRTDGVDDSLFDEHGGNASQKPA